MALLNPPAVQSSHEQAPVITLDSLGLDSLGNPYKVVAPIVYVGRICQGVIGSESFDFEKMLGFCDKVLKWKRTEGANFGFCEFETFLDKPFLH